MSNPQNPNFSGFTQDNSIPSAARGGAGRGDGVGRPVPQASRRNRHGRLYPNHPLAVPKQLCSFPLAPDSLASRSDHS